MYKKTKPRSVMELLNKNLSEREVAAILGCSRNTVSEIKELCRQQGMTWDDIQDMTDDGLYDILYPKKFKRTTNYVPVDYAYVHSELKKTGVTMKLLWEEYRDRCVSEGREYCAYPTFTVNIIINLAAMGFVATATNLIITGPTGAGKTYLLCALGIEACKKTYRVFYIRMPDLMRNFEDRRDDLKELTRYRKRLGNYNILIIDEWLNYKLNERDAKMLYELFEQRSGNNSTIFVGQFPVAEWHDRLGGGTQADSIMDRIVHNAYEIPSSETNLRKIYESKKLANLKAEIEK